MIGMQQITGNQAPPLSITDIATSIGEQIIYAWGKKSRNIQERAEQTDDKRQPMGRVLLTSPVSRLRFTRFSCLVERGHHLCFILQVIL